MIQALLLLWGHSTDNSGNSLPHEKCALAEICVCVCVWKTLDRIRAMEENKDVNGAGKWLEWS